MRRQWPHLMCALAMLPLLAARAAEPAGPEVEFNAAFLQGGAQVDLARFARGNPVLPGDYLVDLYINSKWVNRASVHFIAQPGSDIAQPCIERAIFDRIGVDLARLPESALIRLESTGSTGCVDVASLIQDASVKFEISNLRLDISVPQASLAQAPRDYVSPEYWDAGVTSATVGYNLNTYRAATYGRSSTRSHIDVQTGVNYGSWHLRHRSALDLESGGSTTYHSVAAYLAHDIPAIRSNLTIGDSYTDGAVFDSFGFRGVSLASSDQMLPDSRRDFAPTVRGIARTNARIVITQNGVPILNTTVSPGPFELNDLYATGYGGDLDVVIHEADGTEESFVVPYSPIPQLLRPGVWRFNLTAGSVQQPSLTDTELVYQATAQRGISSLWTAYGGALWAEHYNAASLGVALNTAVGSLSMDAIFARSSILDGASDTGEGLRISYTKLLQSTQTSISLSASPYLSQHFAGFVEAESLRNAVRVGTDPDSIDRVHNQWQISVNQTLSGRRGNFFLSSSVRTYWSGTRSALQLQGGYTNKLRLGALRLSYAVAFARQDNPLTGGRDKRLQASFSLPLGRSAHSPMLSTGFNQSTSAGTTTRGGQEILIGNLGENHQLSYSMSASQSSGDSAYAVSGQYRGAYSSASASASTGSGYSQQSFGATGGLVIHHGGVTLSNQLTDTVGVVEAAGAEGARVTNNVGTVVNHAGYAVLPFLLPYRMNSITIDPEGARSADVEFKSTTQLVAPRLNSVVLIHFDTVSGQAILISARLADGSAVPFGASILDAEGGEVGLAGQDGRIYLRGIAEAGTLNARWGDAPDERCSFTYQLPAKRASTDPFMRLDTVCRVAGPAGQQ